MLQTLLIYILLLITMIVLSRYSSRCFYKGKCIESNWDLFFLLFFYSLIFGLRYGVGIDHLAYLEKYLLLQDYDFSFPTDVGFFVITDCFAKLNVHYSIYFGFLAFMQLFFIYYFFKDDRRVYPYITFVFITSCQWLIFMNGIRQELAFTVFLLGIKYIENQKFFKYLIVVLIASSIHKSAIMLILFYPLLKNKSYFSNILIQLLLLFVAFVLLKIDIVEDLIMKFDNIALFMGYSHYIDQVKEGNLDYITSDMAMGVGSYIILIIDVCIILYSNQVKQYFKKRCFYIIYDIYFIGVLWHYIFLKSLIMSRPNFYMYGFQFVMGTLTLFYLFQKMSVSKMKEFILIVFLCLHISLFSANMYRMKENTAKYYFFWQEKQYKLND